jgi:HAMP domain-containing protein
MEAILLLIQMAVTIPLGWLWVRQNKFDDKINNVFTKVETKEFIDLKNKPIIDAVDRNTKAQEDLAMAIKELRQELVRHIDV